VVAAVNEVEIEKEEELASKHLPRNCKVTKWPDFQGYGFNLHAERDRVGQFIGLIDDDSPKCTKSDMSITVIYHAVSLTVLYVCIKHVHIIDILPLEGFEHCLTIDNSEDIFILLDL
jgi:hypothetical protein